MPAYTLKHTITLPTKQATRFYGIIIACLDSKKQVALNIAQTYVDESEGEDYYCCAWSVDPIEGAPLLAVAGALGIITHLLGRSTRNEINEIKFHPRDPSLIFSASKDDSIRLWNLETMKTIVIFGGENGHREPVLSIDVHLTGDFLVSSGMDHAIKIWTLCTPVMKHAIETSFLNSSSSSSRPPSSQEKCCSSHGASSKKVTVHYPIFTTTQLHNNYVDCVRWYGDLLLSRCAADAKIMLWKPDVELIPFDKSSVTTVVVGGPAAPSKQQASFNIICELEFSHCDIWFLRFGMSYDYRMLATGNQAGQIYLWDLHDVPHYIDDYIKKKKAEYSSTKKEKTVVKKKRGTSVANRKIVNILASGSNSRASADNRKPTILNSTACESIIRQIDFSNDRQWIVAVCDDGSIWCWKNNEVEDNVVDDNNINRVET
ncbi:hypothetical protein RclHR1_00930024 [Rhizophagus clarus]|uniref:Uncharacterized protein n=1 Tax=Rhizophagus clarus TaxID=94130 RepID=A0A2Z6S4A2_9GLOM|nr:hypothetical protein RclHR1_00930024 [Rhizophagus clarus]